MFLLGCACAQAWATGDVRVGIVRIDRIEQAPAAPSIATARALPETAYVTQDSTSQLAGAVRGNGGWRLQPAASEQPRVLLVYHPYSARVTVLAPPLYQPCVASIFTAGLDPSHSRRALAFPLDAPGPVYIGVEGARYPLQVMVRSAHAYAVEDHRHVRVLWLSLGILIGVTLVVLLFWLQLRDRVYLLFAASMALQLLYVLCAYGDAYTMPGLAWLARFGVAGIWFIATSSTIVTVCFLLEFADLRPRAPWLSRALWLVGAALPALLLLALVSPWPADKGWFPPLGNGLLLLGNLLAVLTLLTVWLRGGRHAGFVLIAWVPLVTVSTARAMQLSAGVPLAPWLEYGLPIMQAFAAVVLVLGLADRMLTFRRERDAAQQHAEHDALTGVLNRAGIITRLDRAIAETRRKRLPLSVLFLDLDRFKAINDSYGHPVGDACLCAVIDAIHGETMPEFQLGRIGGEEFLLLLPGSHAADARGTAERIRRKVEASCRMVKDAPVALTLSVGVVECDPTDTAATLIKRADEAMYRAKHEGRNRVVVLAAEA
ncbi:diguanylate cyclase domain-containing protein [Lysobacter cavernae]|uniref:diguanylate cyclase n=1 Tax=Lysobacter cavernae TaxID=1685901 RepID=A0ABV7RLG7_9GAMM